MHNRPPYRVPICFLITGMDVGGAETQLARLVARMDLTIWDPCIVSMVDFQADWPDLKEKNIPIISLGMRRRRPSFSGISRLVQILRQRRTRILVCFLFHAIILGRVVGRLVGVRKIIASFRNDHSDSEGLLWLLRITRFLDTGAVVNSRLVAEHLSKLRVIESHRSWVIPNGIVLTESHRESRANLLFTWISVGRLDYVKGFDVLLAAWKIVLQSRPDAVLWVVGDGGLKGELEQTIESLGLRGSVRMLGFRDDVGELLAAADAFVLASRSEGLPNVVMEAMAQGKPVVSTAVGGIPELVSDEVTGYLVPTDEPAHLSEKMSLVMGLSVSARREMGNNGRAAMVPYDVQETTRMWTSLLLGLTLSKEEKIGP